MPASPGAPTMRLAKNGTVRKWGGRQEVGGHESPEAIKV